MRPENRHPHAGAGDLEVWDRETEDAFEERGIVLL